MLGKLAQISHDSPFFIGKVIILERRKDEVFKRVAKMSILIFNVSLFFENSYYCFSSQMLESWRNWG